MILGLIIIAGIVFGLMLIAYDDGVPYSMARKLMCKLGRHKIHDKIGRLKIHKYYCEFCKKPRKHPVLKVVDGGNKMGNNRYKF